MLRATVGVIVGFVVWSVLWLVGGLGLRAMAPGKFDAEGATSDAGVLAVVLVLSVVCSVISGWVAGAIARGRPVRAAVVLGVVLLAVGVAVQASMWDRMPLWYHAAFLVLLVPATIAGGAIHGGARTRPVS